MKYPQCCFASCSTVPLCYTCGMTDTTALLLFRWGVPLLLGVSTLLLLAVLASWAWDTFIDTTHKESAHDR